MKNQFYNNDDLNCIYKRLNRLQYFMLTPILFSGISTIKEQKVRTAV